MSDLYWLTDEQIARLQPYFFGSHGKPRIDDRRVLSGIVFVNHNGLRWCDALKDHSPYKPVLTWDQGAEMAPHARLKVDAGVDVYFCGPQSLWQCGTSENINGLLRRHCLKGTDLGAHSAETLAAVAATLNGRLRKTLGWEHRPRRSTNVSNQSTNCSTRRPVGSA